MQRIDLLLVGVLVLAAVASAVGVVTYDDDRLATFRVAWATSEKDVDAEGSGEEFTADVTLLNVTRAVWTATVSGSPARVQPILIRVEVVAPDNTSAEAESELPVGPTASVEVPVELALGEPPTTAIATGASIDAARARLPTATNGTGTWTIRVMVAQAGPVGAESVNVQVRGTLTIYEATLTPETPEVSRG